MRTSSNPRSSFPSAFRLAKALATVSALAGGVVLVASCGGGGSQSNPPLPKVVIDVVHQFVDVGQRYVLDGGRTTDPNGDFEDIDFDWRIISGGDDDTRFDDHCRLDFDEICSSNDDDHCSNDLTRFCNVDSDCENFGTCTQNSGTTSPDCTEGICGLGEGDAGVKATMVANVAGPFQVRLSAIGSKSNGTKTIILDTYPSLYLVGSLIQFGGTGGALLGAVADADEFATGASEGVANPANGNLVVIDDDLGIVRVFDLVSGEIQGAFGESDRFVTDPAALAFNSDNGRLYVAQADGEVLMFDGTSGLLVSTFGNVGAGPMAMRFSPITGNLLVVSGVAGSGVRVFDADGNALGVLGDTDTETTEPVDFDFLGDESDLLIADRTGRVVRCAANGTGCAQFSTQADNMLAAGSPSAIAVNPSAADTDRDVLIADPVAERVIACDSDGTDCSTFGDTDAVDSEFLDVFFAPSTAPTTTTSTSTTTTTTLK